MNGAVPTPIAAKLLDSLPQTLEQCHRLIFEQAQQIDLLRQSGAALEQKLILLEEQVKLNSRNSSKPPSSDAPGRPNRAQRRASGRKRGAQKGHPGAYRELLASSEVDAVHPCEPPSSCECGAVVQRRGKPLRHQVFDAPPVKPRVDEYQLYSGVCVGCGKPHRAALPAGVPSGQIGPRALAIVGLLATQGHLTQGKIAQILAALTGVKFSVGAISQAHGKVSAALASPVAQAAASVTNAAVVHIDETHYGREGTSGHWVWAMVTPQVVAFNIVPSRARYVAQDLLGTSPRPILVSDRYAVYDYVNVQQRQVCWAHLLRDFTRMAERGAQAGRIGRRLLGLGYVMFRWRAQGCTDFEPLQRRIRQALQQGCSQQQCSRTAKTCANVLKLWPALWTFLSNSAVPPTNNAAEQALRSLVLKRKISGPTRSRRGEQFLARGFSVLQSCRLQGRNVLDFMHQAISAWIGKTTPPSLVPTG